MLAWGTYGINLVVRVNIIVLSLSAVEAPPICSEFPDSIQQSRPDSPVTPKELRACQNHITTTAYQFQQSLEIHTSTILVSVGGQSCYQGRTLLSLTEALSSVFIVLSLSHQYIYLFVQRLWPYCVMARADVEHFIRGY